ncbi:MAG: hypothetical protein POELPBGB_03907 [Bacteroidia bacterium]|nr:hypothetical protein [Bacteroidia bacterium]
MAAKKYKSGKSKSLVKEPEVGYSEKKIHIFNSFAEQEQYELEQMAVLTPVEILQQMRKFINTAFAMHGYNPEKLPKKHTITIVTKSA